jgi:hypothetical protein
MADGSWLFFSHLAVGHPAILSYNAPAPHLRPLARLLRNLAGAFRLLTVEDTFFRQDSFCPHKIA